MISRIYLQNWKSHHETELTFSEGVNVLVGEMGSGKSSVVEAIIFALYGTTPALQSRKVTLANLIRRSPVPASECVVELDFVRDGETYTVRREITRSGDTAKTDTSELRKDGELLEAPQATEVTEKVEQILEIDYELFARSIYAEQNHLDYFLTLRAGERKQKVDDLLQLNRFENARKTLVSLINRLEGRREDREEDLASLKDDLDEEVITTLQKKVEDGQDRLKEKQKHLSRLTEKHESVQKQYTTLKGKKESFEELKEKRTALRTRIESVTDQIEKLTDQVDEYADLSKEDVSDEKETLTEKKQVLHEQKERLEELDKQLSILQDRKEQHEKKLKTLQEKAEQVEQLEDITEALTEQEEELESVKKQVQEHHTRLQDVKKSMQNMTKAADECPTCGQELTDEHRLQFLQEKKSKKQELEQQLDSLAEKKQEWSKTVKQLREQKEDLLQYKNVQDERDECEQTLETLSKKIKNTQEQQDELAEMYDADQVETVEEKLNQLENVTDLNTLREERTERVEQLEQVQESLSETAFDEEKMESVRERKNELEKQQDVLKNDIKNKKEMIEERKKRLDELKKKSERIEKYENLIITYRRKNDMLNELLKALEHTQVELRNQFIESVNEMMDDIWQQVYPYDDYEGIRLNATDGYLLEVRDMEGNWISVNGEVSGGERHAAALTLRIALSILLTPTWRLLILDEPTHNLDVTAIEELADTLRTEVSDIVGQLFLITHEERLETAVTGELYKLAKKETDTGLTVVEQVTGV